MCRDFVAAPWGPQPYLTRRTRASPPGNLCGPYPLVLRGNHIDRPARCKDREDVDFGGNRVEQMRNNKRLCSLVDGQLKASVGENALGNNPAMLHLGAIMTTERNAARLRLGGQQIDKIGAGRSRMRQNDAVEWPVGALHLPFGGNSIRRSDEPCFLGGKSIVAFDAQSCVLDLRFANPHREKDSAVRGAGIPPYNGSPASSRPRA
ncbi:hypothetical protein SAMN06295937_102849 [Sphingopyxis flava]|uniref:Uncharacterized protein n=1 Tax=Sphingopyxis flava TaxID=1507287 RepID=A0A1T5F4T0_9SPHN|nr:hypothetical protein SAMN06295937_102849 [Sphingopyxis flava]